MLSLPIHVYVQRPGSQTPERLISPGEISHGAGGRAITGQSPQANMHAFLMDSISNKPKAFNRGAWSPGRSFCTCQNFPLPARFCSLAGGKCNAPFRQKRYTIIPSERKFAMRVQAFPSLPNVASNLHFLIHWFSLQVLEFAWLALKCQTSLVKTQVEK